MYLNPDHDSPSARSQVAGVWQEFLGNRAEILTREQAITNNLFGDVVSVDACDRMGDVIAITKDAMVLIDSSREEKESAMVGHHGSNSDIECEVALLTTTLS